MGTRMRIDGTLATVRIMVILPLRFDPAATFEAGRGRRNDLVRSNAQRLRSSTNRFVSTWVLRRASNILTTASYAAKLGKTVPRRNDDTSSACGYTKPRRNQRTRECRATTVPRLPRRSARRPHRTPPGLCSGAVGFYSNSAGAVLFLAPADGHKASHQNG